MSSLMVWVSLICNNTTHLMEKGLAQFERHRFNGNHKNVKFKVIYSVANISSITCYYGSNVFVIGIQEIHLVSC